MVHSEYEDLGWESATPSLRDAQKYDAMAKLRRASHAQISAALETMSDENRDALAWRIRDLAIALGTPRMSGEAVELCELIAEVMEI